MKKGMWIKKGDMDHGEVPDCYRCGISIEDVNPIGVMWLTFNSVAFSKQLMVLCDKCSIAIGEFFHPELTADPSYLAERDQYEAAIREVFGDRDA